MEKSAERTEEIKNLLENKETLCMKITDENVSQKRGRDRGK